jgi:benzylsuccinate CoA-transferase BbsF subunit
MPPSATGSSDRRSGPLAGVKVVELASVWAGPCSAMLMGLLGASVVKVESVERPDLTRRSGVDLNSSPSFHLANVGKRSVALELDRPRDVALFLELAAEAAVVITNIQPESLGRKGVSYEHCRARNPGLVWGQISTSGTEGPEKHFKGYAPSFNALSGLSSLTGYEDGTPAEMRSGGDMRVAYDLTLLCIAALLQRRATGEGKFVDLSCREVLTARIGDQVIDHQYRGARPRTGNEQPGIAPAGVYPCANEDWLAVEIRDDAAWARFAALAGDDRPRLRDAIARWEHREEVEALVSGWTQQRTSSDAAAELQALDIAASPSMSNMRLAELPHLWQRRLYWQWDEQDDRGPSRLVSAPWGSPANAWESLSVAFEALPPRAPHLGEHTDEVLGALGVTAG